MNTQHNPQMKSPVHLGGQRGLEVVNETHKGNVTMNMVTQTPANESLIPVLEGEIGGIVQPVVNARELHKWLKSGEMFAHWIKARISKYDFIENEDFSLVWENPQIKKTGRGGNRRSREYILTLDMAKELSMVENNDQGKKARRYFIQCERAILQANQSLWIQFSRMSIEVEKFCSLASDAGRTLNVVGKRYKPEALRKLNELKDKIQPELRLELGGVL